MVVLALLACTSGLIAIPADTDPSATPDTDTDAAGAPIEVEPAPDLVLNEIVAGNSSGVGGTGETDWIELYNRGPARVDLADVTLTDGEAIWRGEGVLRPGEYRVILADGEGLRADDAPFRLSGDGERLTLALSDGTVLDRIATGDLPDDLAWARIPDGGGFDLTTRATPGWTNGSRPSRTIDPRDELFGSERVLDVRLGFGPDGISRLRSDPRTPVPASFVCAAARFEAVGVRVKGGAGSTRSIDAKASLKIDLDLYEDHEFMGLGKITLNNVVQDPTYLHEHMAYALFRSLGVPAPRVGWARVWFGDEYVGLYTHIESVDSRFLETWYGDGSGILYEGAYGSDLTPGGEGSFDIDQGPEDWDRSDLTAVIDILAGPADDGALQDLDLLVDMDEFLTVMAVEAVAMHWDGYTTRNNYRLYHDPITDRFSMIPWGTDQTFMEDYLGLWGAQGRMFQFCLENAGCSERYSQALLRAADRLEQMAFQREITLIEGRLRPDIEAETRSEHDISTHDYYMEITLENLDVWPDEVRERVAEH